MGTPPPRGGGGITNWQRRSGARVTCPHVQLDRMRRALALTVLAAAILAGCGSTDVDREVMDNTANEACRKAVENSGYTGDFTYRINRDGDGAWVGAITVDSATGRRSFTCEATQDGDTVNATVEPL